MTRTIYFGPSRGFYEPRRFNDFALIDVPRKLEEIGSPSQCNSERVSGKGDASSANPMEGVTYHYPDSGIGLFYQIVRGNRCIVNLMGTRERELGEITDFIFESDSKQ